MTEIWLNGDHYKWRAMRANGISEKFITGDASDKDKFMKWSQTVPYTMRNPLYHWTHIELQRYFGIHDILNADSADTIYEATSEKLRSPSYSTQKLLKKMNVEVVCTTDDPADTLEHHVAFDEEEAGFKMLPGFRPDKIIQIDSPDFLNSIKKLEESIGQEIASLQDLIEGIQGRINFFHDIG